MDRYPTIGTHRERTLNHFDLNAEVERLRHGRVWERTGRNAKTLSKEPRLRILLTAMKAGEKLHEQRVEDRISIQTVKGRIKLQSAGKSVLLPSGHMAVLEPGVEYTAEAQEDCALLLSISWSGQAGVSEQLHQARAPSSFSVSPTRPWKRL